MLQTDLYTLEMTDEELRNHQQQRHTKQILKLNKVFDLRTVFLAVGINLAFLFLYCLFLNISHFFYVMFILVLDILCSLLGPNTLKLL